MQAETMQKQRTTSKTKSYICRILLLLGVLLLAVGLWYGVQGYQMYRNVLAETPIAEKTAAIEQQESFVPYDALPQIYVDAVISVEDQRFFSHSGVDISAMIRALWNDLRTRSFAEGGSTISQQLAKNQYFTQEKTLQRKLAEMFLAHAWEQVCEKQELFALYVIGDGYTGISEAAEGYFHTTPQQLTDYEAVMLAGLPNAPSAYALQEHADLAEQRMQQVLQAMVANQKLTQSEANEILQEKS
ncbi:MAG: transglycosylase domain-containing protein [Ruminococcus sp.]